MIELGGGVESAENNAEYKLYPTKKASLKKNYKIGTEYLLAFSDSVRGLSVGAPVDFRGLQIGEVTDIQLSFNIDQKKVLAHVTITVDYGRISFKGNTLTAQEMIVNHRDRTNGLINIGLRGQLKTGSLLTGELYIGFDFYPDQKPYVVDWTAKIPELPTMPGTLAAVERNVTSILHKADAMMTQLNQLSYKLNHKIEPELAGTMRQLNRTLAPQLAGTLKQLNHNIAPELSATLKQATASLATVEETLKNESPLQQDLQTALRELTKAARALKTLANYLERHPESLIEGKK